jgi:hypothetical protein
MDVREKLEVIAHLGDHISYKEDIGICYDSDLAKVVEDAYMTLKNGVTVQEWISTDERMPTEDDATDGYVAVVYSWGDCVKTKTISLVDVVIAHPDLYDYWMPLNLPQPPKGE